MFCFCVFFGGFKGHVRWPEGPPHLALNPYLFICFFVFVFLFFFGGFKVLWPPHLALNPPFFFSFVFFVFCFLGSFPFFVFNRKTLFSP